MIIASASKMPRARQIKYGLEMVGCMWEARAVGTWVDEQGNLAFLGGYPGSPVVSFGYMWLFAVVDGEECKIKPYSDDAEINFCVG